MNERLTTILNRLRSRPVPQRFETTLSDDLAAQVLDAIKRDGTNQAQWLREAAIAKVTRAEAVRDVAELRDEVAKLRARLEELARET